MTSVKVKFTPSSVILKEGTVHYQIIHHCKVRHIRTGYKLFPSVSGFLLLVKSMSRQEVEKAEKAILSH